MKRKGFAALVVVCAVVFAASGMVAAQTAPDPNAQVRPRKGCEKNFEKLDANQDGQVSKEEFMAAPHHRGKPERIFANRDQNGDGVLTKDEFCAAGRGARGRGCEKNFAEMDANQDGQVSKEEFMAAPHRRGDPERIFANRDQNGDGVLTKDEFCARPGPGRRAGRGTPQE